MLEKRGHTLEKKGCLKERLITKCIDRNGGGQTFEEDQQVIIFYKVVIFWIWTMGQTIGEAQAF